MGEGDGEGMSLRKAAGEVGESDGNGTSSLKAAGEVGASDGKGTSLKAAGGMGASKCEGTPLRAAGGVGEGDGEGMWLTAAVDSFRSLESSGLHLSMSALSARSGGSWLVGAWLAGVKLILGVIPLDAGPMLPPRRLDRQRWISRGCIFFCMTGALLSASLADAAASRLVISPKRRGNVVASFV